MKFLFNRGFIWRLRVAELNVLSLQGMSEAKTGFAAGGCQRWWWIFFWVSSHGCMVGNTTLPFSAPVVSVSLVPSYSP